MGFPDIRCTRRSRTAKNVVSGAFVNTVTYHVPGAAMGAKSTMESRDGALMLYESCIKKISYVPVPNLERSFADSLSMRILDPGRSWNDGEAPWEELVEVRFP